MNANLHDYRRQLRVLLRNIRYSRLVCGSQQVARIRASLAEVYSVTNHFLRSLDVDYWLVYGTLLGCYREGQLIAGDRDVDFGAHEKEYTKIWRARDRLPAGFHLIDTSRRHYGPKLYVVHHGWEADIYFYRDANHQLQSYEKSSNRGDMQPFPKAFVYPLQATTFLGEPTNIPQDARAYLEHTYGYIGKDAVKDKTTGYWRKQSG
jgi:hypothetical protein